MATTTDRRDELSAPQVLANVVNKHNKKGSKPVLCRFGVFFYCIVVWMLLLGGLHEIANFFASCAWES